VPNVITDLIRANIKICMLTGDKLETAENIAKSCGIFRENLKIIKIA
jgi:phospholipid-transporting ATPase